MGIQLDERLSAVAELVREGSVVADIGTDHGLLVCHLVASRKCPRAFACDINQGPLDRAAENIRREGLGARILTMRCDGLSGIPGDAVQDVVIAGMGGDLIARILFDWEGCRDEGKRFILQPMSKPEHLRRELYRMGFVLLEECAVRCRGFVYAVMAACYTGHCMEVSPHFCHTGRLWEREPCDEATRDYLRGVHALFLKKAEGYARSAERAHRAVEYRELASMLEQKIGRG